MKEKEYKELFSSTNDLYDGYLYFSSHYDDYKDKNTLKSLNENKEKLKEVLSSIDALLTMNMS